MAALAGAGAPFVEQSANEDEYPIEGTYLVEFAQESEARARFPKNAALLETLVFVLSFGLVLRWVLVSGWMAAGRRAARPSGVGSALWFICISDEASLPSSWESSCYRKLPALRCGQ